MSNDNVRDQIRQDGESLRRLGVSRDHVRRVEDSALRQAETAINNQERDRQRRR